MKRVLFFFLLILSIHFINAQPLSQRLDALLHEEVLKTSEVGIAVFDLTAGESVYRYQDDKLYRPASVEKIIHFGYRLGTTGSRLYHGYQSSLSWKNRK